MLDWPTICCFTFQGHKITVQSIAQAEKEFKQLGLKR